MALPLGALRPAATTICGSRSLRLACATATALLALSAPPRAEPPPSAAPVTREVSLAELLHFAERHAPSLRAAELRRGYGEAAQRGALPLLRHNPSLELGVGPRRQGGSARDVDLAFSLDQPVEIAGQRGLRRSLAERLTERLENEVDATRWKLRHDVAVTYRVARVARERVRAGERVVAFARDVLDTVTRRHAAGDASAIDVRLAEADVARAQQARVLAESELHRLLLELCEITGWPADTPPQPPPGLEPPRPIPALATVLAAARDDHPELRARRAAVAEARARAALADREGWPTPTVGVSVLREGRGEARGEAPSYILLGEIGLPLPIWNRNQEERGRAGVEEALARAEATTTARALRTGLVRAHAALAAAATRLDLGRTALEPSLEHALALLTQGLAAGELSLAEATVARERLLRAQEDALSAHEDYARALAELEFLLGSELPPPAEGATAR